MTTVFNPQAQQPQQDALGDMGVLQRIAIGLGGVGAVDAAKRSAMMQQQQQQEMSKMEALKQLGEQMQGGQIDRNQALIKYAGISGDYSGLFGGGAQTPSAIQEYQYYNSLPPEEQSRYLGVKRANQMFDRGGTQVFVDPSGNVVNEIQKTLAPEQLPQTKQEQAAATALGKAQGEKVSGLDGAMQSTNQTLDLIDTMLADKEGLDSSVGGPAGLKGVQSSILPVSPSQRRFSAYEDQLKGKVFVEAFQGMKGAGVITDLEGQKAEKAMARLDRRLDRKDFEKALTDLREVVAIGQDRMKKMQKEGLSATPSIGQGAQQLVGQSPSGAQPATNSKSSNSGFGGKNLGDVTLDDY